MVGRLVADQADLQSRIGFEIKKKDAKERISWKKESSKDASETRPLPYSNGGMRTIASKIYGQIRYVT